MVFWSFRIMAGLGVLMILMSVAAWVLRRRGRLFESKWFQRFAVAMGPLPGRLPSPKSARETSRRPRNAGRTGS